MTVVLVFYPPPPHLLSRLLIAPGRDWTDRLALPPLFDSTRWLP
jgi:hypothetical protein